MLLLYDCFVCLCTYFMSLSLFLHLFCHPCLSAVNALRLLSSYLCIIIIFGSLLLLCVTSFLFLWLCYVSVWVLCCFLAAVFLLVPFRLTAIQVTKETDEDLFPQRPSSWSCFKKPLNSQYERQNFDDCTKSLLSLWMMVVYNYCKHSGAWLQSESTLKPNITASALFETFSTFCKWKSSQSFGAPSTFSVYRWFQTKLQITLDRSQ